jgi:uncharacterized protein
MLYYLHMLIIDVKKLLQWFKRASLAEKDRRYNGLDSNPSEEILTGTVINTAAILVGAAVGLLLRRRIGSTLETRLIQAMGIFTLALGVSMFLKTREPLVPLVSLVAGGALGYLVGLTDWIQRIGEALKGLLSRGPLKPESGFSEGFVTASILFCVGPMTILGSLNDGLRGDYELLSIKSAMDFTAALALSAGLGWGVAISAVSVFFIQGTLTLSAPWIAPVLSDARVTADLTGVGGLIVMIIGLKLSGIGKWSPADYLPALVLAPFIAYAGLRWFGG